MKNFMHDFKVSFVVGIIQIAILFALRSAGKVPSYQQMNTFSAVENAILAPMYKTRTFKVLGYLSAIMAVLFNLNPAIAPEAEKVHNAIWNRN